MLPFFHRYDHTNYARWGCVYLEEMRNLPTYVEEEFKKGNFVVKGSGCRKFNQVDPDHSQEWLNGTGKRGGGTSALPRLPQPCRDGRFSFNFRAQISAKTRQMLNGGDGNAIIHNEATLAKIKRDNSDEGNIVKILEQFKVFAPLNLFTVLQLKTSQPLKSKNPFLARKSLDSQSWTPILKKGWWTPLLNSEIDYRNPLHWHSSHCTK